MKELMKKLKNSQNGITLIALVITIIVMLILVGVTVSTVINSGLFNYAGEAARKWGKAQEEEANVNIDDLIHEITTGIVVEKVTDENPGQLEQGKDSNTFIINSIEDLVFFAYDVTSGNNLYEGKTVTLGLSLDFNSTKSYVNALRTDYGQYGYDGELKKLLTTRRRF